MITIASTTTKITAETKTINIAILDCLVPIPSIINTRSSFPSIFLDLLRSAANRLTTRFPDHFSGKSICITGQAYDVVQGQYPGAKELGRFDAVLITGSFSSVYDGDGWIGRLLGFVREIYTHHPQIRIFGSCFGHQILAEVLLSHPSPLSSTPSCSPAVQQVVQRNPAGPEVGLQTITLSPEFTECFPRQFPPSSFPYHPTKNIPPSPAHTLTLQFIHADHVLSSPLSPIINIGTTPLCSIQGLFIPHRILSFQGHVEFDAWINREVVRAFFSGREGGEEGKREELLGLVGEEDGDAGVLGGDCA